MIFHTMQILSPLKSLTVKYLKIVLAYNIVILTTVKKCHIMENHEKGKINAK